MDVEGLFFKIGADLTGLKTAFDQIGSMASMMGGESIANLGNLLTNAITKPLMGIGSAAIEVAGKFEQTKMAFTSLLGGAEKANALLAQLRDFALKTPFEFPGLTDAAKKMLALGFNAEQIVPSLRKIGDAVAALGGNTQMMDRMVLALGQMQARMKVSAQEMNQLANAGIPAWDILAKKIGVSIPEAMAMAKKGLIDGVTGMNAILDGMGTKFAGMMEKQAQTTLGKYSNLKDQMTKIMTDIGLALLPMANRAMEALVPILEMVKKAVEAFAALPEPLKDAIVVFAGLAAAAGPLLVAFGTISASITAIKLAVPGLIGAAGIGGLAIAFAGAAAAALGFIKVMETAFAIKNMNQAIAGAVQSGKDLESVVKKLEVTANSLGIHITRSGKSIEQYAMELNKAVRAHPDYIAKVQQAAEVQAKVAPSVEQTVIAIQKQTGAVVAAAQAKAAAIVKAAEWEAAIRKGAAAVEYMAQRTEALAKVIPVLPEAFQLAGVAANRFGIDAQNALNVLEQIQNESLPALSEIPPVLDAAAEELGNVADEGNRAGTELTTAGTKATGAWGELGRNLSRVWDDFAGDIVGAIKGANSFGDAMKNVFAGIRDAFLNLVVKGALNEGMKALTGLTEGFGSLGKSIAGIFGGGGGAGGGIAGGAGGAGGGIAGAAGGLAGTIGAIGSIGSMISGIVGNFQNARMEGTMNKVEENTRICAIQLRDVITNLLNQWLPQLEHLPQLIRLEGIENSLRGGMNMNSDALSAGLQSIAQLMQSGMSLQQSGWTNTGVQLNSILQVGWKMYAALGEIMVSLGRGMINNMPTGNLPIPGGTNRTQTGGTTVNLSTMTNDPYRHGQQVVQAINQLTPARGLA